MASKRTPCVVGTPRIYHYSTNVASTCHTRVAHFVTLAHLLQPSYSSSRCRLLFLLLLALHIVQAHTSVYVCAQYDALTPRPLDERNNVYAPPQDQLSMVFTVTKLRSRYDTTTNYLLKIYARTVRTVGRSASQAHARKYARWCLLQL